MSGPTIAELQLKLSAHGLPVVWSVQKALKAVGSAEINRQLREQSKALLGIETAAQRAAKATASRSAAAAARNDARMLKEQARAALALEKAGKRAEAVLDRKWEAFKKQQATELEKQSKALLKVEEAAKRAKKAAEGDGDGKGGMFSGMLDRIGKFGLAAFTIKRSFDMIAGGIESALRPAVDFQKTLADVRIKGAFSAADTGMLGEGMKQRVREGSMFSAQQQAEAGVDLAASGLSAKDVNSMLPTVMRFAQAGDLKTAEASKILTNVANMFGVKTGNTAGMEKLGSQLVKAANLSTISVTDIFNTLKYVGTQSNTAGMDPSQVLAMTAILGNRGITGSKGGTGLRNLFTAMTRPPRRGKAIAALNRQLGLTQADFQRGMENVPGFTQELGRRYDAAGFTKAQRLGANAMYFGQYGSTTSDVLMKATQSNDVGKAVRNNLKKGKNGQWTYDEKNAVEEYTKAIHNAGNAMKEAADIAGGTMSAKLAVFSNKWDLLKITIGERFFPVIERGMDRVSKLVDKWEASANKNPKAFDSIIQSVETFANLLPPALTAMVTVLRLVEPLVGLINKVLGPIAAAMGDKPGQVGIRAPKAGAPGSDTGDALYPITDPHLREVLGLGPMTRGIPKAFTPAQTTAAADALTGQGNQGGQSTVGIKIGVDKSGNLKAYVEDLVKGRLGPQLRTESSVNL